MFSLTEKRALKLEVKIPIYAKVIEHIYGTWFSISMGTLVGL